MAVIDLNFQTPLIWGNILALGFGHLGFLYGLYLTFTFQIHFMTFIFALIVGFIGLLSVAVGVHRHFTHKSFKATLPLRLLFLYRISVTGQFSAYTWIKIHKMHHEFCETDADPHNAKRGLFFSHIGWVLIKRHPECRAKAKLVDMKDYENDGLIMFQKKYILHLHFIFGFLIPISIPCYFWGETLWNSFFVVYIFRYIISIHHVSVINSFSHFKGTKAYNQDKPGYFSKISHIVAFGIESEHNFHHTFPWDYRCSEGEHANNIAIKIIHLFAKLGMAYDLRKASPEMVLKTVEKYGDGSHDNINKELM